MTRKTSVINKNILDRVSKIFPNVVWKDYTNHYGKALDIEIRQKLHKKLSSLDKVGYFDSNHIILKKIVDSAPNNDIDIINEFYKFKKSRAKIFDYLLPPEMYFYSVAPSASTNYVITSDGIYFFFNKYFIEKKFEDNLFTDLQVQLVNGTNFPLNKAFNENMKEWLCYYDNRKTRFHWDIKEKEKINLGHNPSVPWKAFQNRCQYAYTLVKIGYEERDSSKPISDKSTYQKKGFDYVCDSFELEKKKKYYNSRINKSVDYDESDYCILRGNIEHGLETTPNKDPFKIKDFDQAGKAINIAIRHRKYEQSAKIFDFTDSDIKSIYRIYDDYQTPLGLPPINNRKKDFRSAFDVLNRRSVLLNDTDKKRIEEIAEKIAIKNPIPQSKTKNENENENEYDCTDKEASKRWEDEENIRDVQRQIKELAECFCAEFPNDEKEFKDCIKQLIGKPDGIKTFAEGLNDLECKDKASESELVKMYSRLYKSADITSIVKWLKGKKEHALKNIRKYKLWTKD